MLTAKDLHDANRKTFSTRLEAIDEMLRIANARGKNNIQYDLGHMNENATAELISSLSMRGFTVKRENGSTYRDSWNYLRICW